MPARTLAAEGHAMQRVLPVILSKVKDLAGTIIAPGMLCSAQRDKAPAGMARPPSVSAARRGPVANTNRKQEWYPGSSPRVTEALCQSSS